MGCSSGSLPCQASNCPPDHPPRRPRNSWCEN